MRFTFIKTTRTLAAAVSYGAMLLFAAVCLSGCGSNSDGQLPVHVTIGNVSFNGEPLEGATIIFNPASALSAPKGKRSPIPGARTDENGDFQATTYKPGDGIPEGRYKVTISCEDLNKPKLDMKGILVRGEYLELLPPKYQDPDLSGIEVEISEGQNDLQSFVLTR